MKPVLYAEDERDDVFFMRYAWELAGIPNPLVEVKDGREAIDYLAGQGIYSDREKHPLPCLLLLDLNLPGKNGFDVLRWLRKQPLFKRLKVVIVSGSNQENDMATARSLGVTDYIVKPSSPKLLLEIIQQKKGSWFPKEDE